MPTHLEAPLQGLVYYAAEFSIDGWLWLETDHAELAGVEAYACEGGTLLGAIDAAALQPRPDVNQALSLPAETRTGFRIPSRHPKAPAGAAFAIEIRARLVDNRRTAPLAVRLLARAPLERDPHALLLRRVAPRPLGLEVGAHTHPQPGLSPFYTDAVADFAGTAGRVDFISDARALPIASGTLDYLIRSHVLEHLPDPLAALYEWHRVLRPGGLLYLVVPDRRFTFDHPRATTPPEHLLANFHDGTNAEELGAHVEEFVYQTDWARLQPSIPTDQRAAMQAAARARYQRQLEAGDPIDIHFHTFTPESLEAALARAGLTGGGAARFAVLARAERYPPSRLDGIALLLEKTSDPKTSRRHDAAITRTRESPAAQPAAIARTFELPRPIKTLRHCHSCVRCHSNHCTPRPAAATAPSRPLEASATRSSTRHRSFCRQPVGGRSALGTIGAGGLLRPLKRSRPPCPRPPSRSVRISTNPPPSAPSTRSAFSCVAGCTSALRTQTSSRSRRGRATPSSARRAPSTNAPM